MADTPSDALTKVAKAIAWAMRGRLSVFYRPADMTDADTLWLALVRPDREAALAAARAVPAPGPVVPEGWKLVPVEPTPEMIDAYAGSRPDDESVDFAHEDREGCARQVYAAMLSAAPAPAQPAQPDGTSLVDQIADIINPSLCWIENCRCTENAKNAARDKARRIIEMVSAQPDGAASTPSTPDQLDPEWAKAQMAEYEPSADLEARLAAARAPLPLSRPGGEPDGSAPSAPLKDAQLTQDVTGGHWTACVTDKWPDKRLLPHARGRVMEVRGTFATEAEALAAAEAAIATGWVVDTRLHRETAKAHADFRLPQQEINRIGRLAAQPATGEG